MGDGRDRMTISVVIPVFNEVHGLPDTLGALRRQAGDFETIVVDGGSTDGTTRLLSHYAWVRVLSATKGRASQMNAGARAASGDWLLFLHADTLLPDGALTMLDDWKDRRDIQAGGFRHRFTSDRLGLRLISWLDNWRCHRSRIIYGDQALFVRRRLFAALNGFSERAIMEDVEFCERLTRVTRPKLVCDPVITSSRKFEQMGVWRSFFRVAVILSRHELGLKVAKGPFFSDVR
jgi:rSAM/selenodomain-associated transferase 2